MAAECLLSSVKVIEKMDLNLNTVYSVATATFSTVLQIERGNCINSASLFGVAWDFQIDLSLSLDCIILLTQDKGEEGVKLFYHFHHTSRKLHCLFPPEYI